MAENSCEHCSEHLGSIMSSQIKSTVNSSPKSNGDSICFTLKVLLIALLKFLLISSI